MKKAKLLLTLLALLAFTATAWAQQPFNGQGTEAEPYQISSTADWNTLADYVNDGNDDYKASCYLLTEDISVTKMVGKEGKYFEGTFDGGGHTLTFSINISSYDDDGVAPFRFLKNATIKNLHVAGAIKSNSYYIGGIAGCISGSCNFYACRSSVNITSKFSDHYSGFHGGLVGKITYGPHTFVNCLYDGRIEVVCCDYVGGLFGNLKTEEGGVEAAVSVINCMFAPSGYYISHCEYVGDLVPRRTNLPSTILHFCHTDKDFGDEEGWDAYGCLNQQLLDYLGNGWHEVDGKVVPNYAVEVNFSFEGEGTSSSPYLIKNTDDWHKLYMNVLLNNTYRKHYKLTNDITLTDNVTSELPSTMLGSTEEVSFNGVFDGDGHTITLDYMDNSDKHYCGPFRVIKNARIENLHVTGIIYKAQKKHVGGLVGKAYGSNYIENCRSSVTIIANTDGDGSHGGFLGDLRGGSTTFYSCIFDGKMEGSGGSDSRTTKWGGFVGWVADGKEATFTNCLFAPAEIHISNTNGSRTFSRRDDGDDVTFTNSYYFQALGSSQANHARSISGNENVNMTPYSTYSPHVYNVSGITTYSNGHYNVNSCLGYNNKYYAGNGNEVLLNLSQNQEVPTPEGATANSFIATPGSLSGTGDPYYALTMPDDNVTISLAPSDWNTHAGTAADPYPIYNAQQWRLMVSRVHSNDNSINGYYGKFFKLMADITLTETHSSGNSAVMVGIADSDNTKFRGTFDGDGHTITLDITDNSGENYCAPFRYLKDGTIKNLHVAGTIHKTDKKNAGGLVGKAEGSNTIRNCRSSVDIFFDDSGDCSSGGFIGELRDGNSTTLTNCLFDGTLRGATAYSWGGFIGWVASGNTATFNNCLFNPAEINFDINDSDDKSKTFARKDGTVIVNNCYYKTLIKDAQGATNATGYENEALRFGLGHGWEIVTEMEIDGTDTTYVEKVVPIMKKHSLSGDGTLASPYLINSEDDWNGLASNVFLGETYSGQYLQLTNHITVNRMIGTGTTSAQWNTYSFSGTFDGDGNTLTFDYSTNVGSEGLIAPFRFVDGATIQNLVVDGTIVAANKYAAGIIGRVDGNTALNNCRSSVIINSSVSGNGGHGGLVGLVRTGSVLTIDGCLFDGKLLGSGTTHCGGLVGEAFKDENYSSTVNITNSLCKPAELTVGTTGSSALVGDSNGNTNITATNSYYTETFGTAQGKQARSITAGKYVATMENAGTAAEYEFSGLTSYGVGIMYDSVLYAGNGDEVYLNLTNSPLPEGLVPGNYYFHSSSPEISLSNTGSNTYRLDMIDADGTIDLYYSVNLAGTGTENDPYRIYVTDQLDHLAWTVNNGHDYNGEYIQLMADLVYDHSGIGEHESNFTPIGHYLRNYEPNDEDYYRPFKGHFDGNGYTISGIRIYSGGTTLNDDSKSLFGYIEGNGTNMGVVKNLTLTDAVITGRQYCGGIVGCNSGGTIDNCRVTSSVFIHGVADGSHYHGGIVGRIIEGGYPTVKNCTSSVTLTNNNYYYYGGIVGRNDGQAVITDNMVIGATIPSTTNYGVIAGYFHSGTLERNYYVSCTVVGVSNATGVGCHVKENAIPNVNSGLQDVTANDGAVPGNVRTVTAPSNWMNVSDGWAFIASPLYDDTDPASTAVENIFNATDYDLYRLNPGTARWENWKVGDGNNAAPGFYLENGRGYLYATQTEQTVKFKGNANAFNLDDTKEVTLGQGFNFVGNPFPRAAWINKPYYTLNSEGSAVLTTPESTATPISPCYGVVVEATSNSETLTFSTTAPSTSGTAHNNGNLNIALSQASPSLRGGTTKQSTLDNAIVSFNEGEQLGKFYFGHQDANICIPQGGEEYAIAFSDKHGEVPVNFKATENGSYTLTVNSENVEMAYLHLIDNLTGAHIDLLTNPSYTFNAHTTDYTSRFKLVFVANDAQIGDEGDDMFAFISNGELIVLGEGTLQIIDVLGHQLFAKQLSTFHSPLSTFTSPGVYVLRLINGENVRTRKIVVK